MYPHPLPNTPLHKTHTQTHTHKHTHTHTCMSKGTYKGLKTAVEFNMNYDELSRFTLWQMAGQEIHSLIEIHSLDGWVSCENITRMVLLANTTWACDIPHLYHGLVEFPIVMHSLERQLTLHTNEVISL